MMKKILATNLFIQNAREKKERFALFSGNFFPSFQIQKIQNKEVTPNFKNFTKK